jgi:hypothetical protein
MLTAASTDSVSRMEHVSRFAFDIAGHGRRHEPRRKRHRGRRLPGADGRRARSQPSSPLFENSGRGDFPSAAALRRNISSPQVVLQVTK